MYKINRSLALVAVSALPLQEVAFAIPHRLEFPFVVLIVCGLIRLCLYALSSNVGATAASCGAIEDPLVYIRGVASELGKREFTVEDLKKAALSKGLTFEPLQYASVLREFRKVGEVVSPNPASKGRKIGVFTN